MALVKQVPRFPITYALVSGTQTEMEQQATLIEQRLQAVEAVVDAIVQEFGEGDAGGLLLSNNIPQAVGPAGVAGVGTLASRDDHVHAYGPLATLSTNFVDNETPTGAVDSANTVFTLSATPDPSDSLMLVLGNAWQFQRTAAGPTFGFFDVSGNTITYEKAPPTGLVHRAWFRV